MAFGLYQKAMHAARFWLLRRLPTCQQMTPVMSESLERQLTLRERFLLKLHLWVCAWCAWYLEQLHMMRDAIGMRATKIADDQSSPALSPEARERLKRALSRTDE